MSITGGNFKAEEEMVTLVIIVPKKDIPLLETYLRASADLNSAATLTRFCNAVLRALPKEDNASNTD